MSRNTEAELINQLAYGSVSRNQIPGDIQDYDITLVRQVVRIRNQKQTRLRLKFTPKQNNFGKHLFINIDMVRTPANCIHVLEYEQKDATKVVANLGRKINKKMLLSVRREVYQPHQDIKDNESEGDSDIPPRRLFKKGIANDDNLLEQYDFQSTNNNNKPRKRRNLGNQDSISDDVNIL